MQRLEGTKEVRELEVSKLNFDTKNFRLRDADQELSQEETLKVLDQKFDLLTIGRSMVDNGYFREDPLVVVPANPAKTKFIVVEGNRRLGALKHLLDPVARSNSKKRAEWDALAASNQHDLTSVPCVIYDKPSEVMTYLGFRHIAGAKRWFPLQKAEFIDFVISQRKKEVDFALLGRQIGIRGETARSYYIAYRAFLQAENSGADTTGFEEDFSVFIRALSSAAITKFLGIERTKTASQLEKPVPKSKLESLTELLGYIYGSQTLKLKRVIGESRDIDDLGRILDKPAALAHLRADRDFDGALQLIGGRQGRLTTNINQASILLDDSLRDAYHFVSEPKVLDAMEKLRKAMKELERVFAGEPAT